MINIIIYLVQGVTMTSPNAAYLTTVVNKLDDRMTVAERQRLVLEPNYSLNIGMLELIINEFKLDDSKSKCRLFFAEYGLIDPDVIAGFILKKYLFTLKKQNFDFVCEVKLSKKIQRSREVPPKPAIK